MNTNIQPNHTAPAKHGVRGPMLTFDRAAARCGVGVPSADACVSIDDAIVVIDGSGIIVDAGPAAEMLRRHPDMTTVENFGADTLIVPGFVDCHTHYVQAPMIASAGNTLLDWLNRYTFPTECSFADPAWAAEVARVFFREMLRQATTTANIFATTFGASVDAIFGESERYGALTISGKVMQDRDLPAELADSSAEASAAETERLLRKWHGRGRLLYAVTPRFALTSTPQLLGLAGELYRAHQAEGVYLHTHLNEEHGEIRRVGELYPGSPTYTDLYRRFGLLGAHTVMAHCCLMEEREWQLLHDNGCGVAHCPSSNLFLGDAIFDWHATTDSRRPVATGLGTDVGGGTTLSIPRQLGEAYKVAMLRGAPFDAARGFYMATLGGAEALGLAHRVGSIAPGMEADLAVVDLRPNEFAGWRLDRAATLLEKFFVASALGPDNLIRATFVGGRKVYDSRRSDPWRYASELSDASDVR